MNVYSGSYLGYEKEIKLVKNLSAISLDKQTTFVRRMTFIDFEK